MPRRLPTPRAIAGKAGVWNASAAATSAHMLGVVALTVPAAALGPSGVGPSCALIAASIVLLRLLARRTPNSRSWAALAAGMLLLGLSGQPSWAPASLTAGLGAEAARVAGYAAMVVGIIGLTPRRAVGDGALPMVDATLFAIGATLLTWVVLLESVVSAGDLAGVAWNATGPLGDILVVVALAQMIFSGATHSPSFRALGLAVMVFLGADLAASWASAEGAAGVVWLSGLGRATGYLLVAAAASHPSSAWFARVPTTTEPDRFSYWRAAGLVGAGLSAPLAILLAWAEGDVDGLPVVALAAGLLLVLLVARVALTVRYLHRAVLRLYAALAERGELEGRLREQADRDPLTWLWNRSAFNRHLGDALSRGEPTTVLFIDLDDFKAVNDTYGHEAGDIVLRETSARLLASIRSGDEVARFGGDEFGVRIATLDPTLAGGVASRVLEALKPSFAVGGGHSVFVRASIGISGMKPDAADELMREADIAMYLAKRRGKGQVGRFEEATSETVGHRLALRSRLEDAIRDESFELHYQPIVSAATGVPTICEALVRWRHPQRGLLLPHEFIGLAEKTGLVVEIGRWVLRTACREAASWPLRFGDLAPSLAVNVSAVQFRHPSLIGDIVAALRESGLPPSRLIVETPESTLSDVDDSGVILAALHGIGVRVALDDFGSGHSSIAEMTRDGVDSIKIDPALISSIGPDGRGTSVVAAIIGVGRAIGASTVAEGVEDSGRASGLAELGCDLIQGYIVCRPLSVEGLASYLRDRLLPAAQAASAPEAAA